MDKITKLSQAIRYGSTFIGEAHWFGVARKGKEGCCPIGTAFVACVTDQGKGEWLENAVARRFNVPLEIVHKVSCDHMTGRFTRAQAADWLEAQGY